ncbi:hypothetical protein [Streptomyces sp. NPDC059909]|uniref:hypothetical protein n=1 Tax=Streptomyces sp. NPDC059909 TaxID=3346998 RepID=UPI0036633A42
MITRKCASLRRANSATATREATLGNAHPLSAGWAGTSADNAPVESSMRLSKVRRSATSAVLCCRQCAPDTVALGQPTGRLIADRVQASDRMRALHRTWETLGPDPLPAALILLERLRAAPTRRPLDTELNRRNPYAPFRHAAGGSRIPPQAPHHPDSSKHTVHDVLDQASDLHESETATVLEDTHAFAIVAASFGHCRTLPSAGTVRAASAPDAEAAGRRHPGLGCCLYEAHVARRVADAGPNRVSTANHVV